MCICCRVCMCVCVYVLVPMLCFNDKFDKIPASICVSTKVRTEAATTLSIALETIQSVITKAAWVRNRKCKSFPRTSTVKLTLGRVSCCSDHLFISAWSDVYSIVTKVVSLLSGNSKINVGCILPSRMISAACFSSVTPMMSMFKMMLSVFSSRGWSVLGRAVSAKPPIGISRPHSFWHLFSSLAT